MNGRIFCVIVLAAGILAAAPATRAADETLYIYSVTDIEGSMSVETFSSSDLARMRDQQNETNKNAKREYAEQQKEWAQVFGKVPFPMSPPKSPKLDQIQRAPANQDAFVKAFEKARDKLEVYNIVMVVNSKGEPSGQMIRRDQMYARQRALEREFVEAAKGYKEMLKKDPVAAQNTDPPKKPLMKLVRENVRSRETAAVILEDFNKELANYERKMAEKEAQKEAERERLRQPEAPEPIKALEE